MGVQIRADVIYTCIMHIRTWPEWFVACVHCCTDTRG